MSDSVRPHRWQPTRLLHPWDSPGKNTGVGCISFSNACMHAKSFQSCPILCDPLDSSPPGSSTGGQSLFIGFPRQEYWSGLPFPSPLFGDSCSYIYLETLKEKYAYLIIDFEYIVSYYISFSSEFGNSNHDSKGTVISSEKYGKYFPWQLKNIQRCFVIIII